MYSWIFSKIIDFAYLFQRLALLGANQQISCTLVCKWSKSDQPYWAKVDWNNEQFQKVFYFIYVNLFVCVWEVSPDKY